MKFSTDQIAWGLTYAFNESAAQLTTVFYRTGTDIGTAIQRGADLGERYRRADRRRPEQLGFTPSAIATQLRNTSATLISRSPRCSRVWRDCGSNIASSLQSAFGDGDRQAATASEPAGHSAGTIGSVLTVGLR